MQSLATHTPLWGRGWIDSTPNIVFIVIWDTKVTHPVKCLFLYPIEPPCMGLCLVWCTLVCVCVSVFLDSFENVMFFVFFTLYFKNFWLHILHCSSSVVPKLFTVPYPLKHSTSRCVPPLAPGTAHSHVFFCHVCKPAKYIYNDAYIIHVWQSE